MTAMIFGVSGIGVETGFFFSFSFLISYMYGYMVTLSSFVSSDNFPTSL